MPSILIILGIWYFFTTMQERDIKDITKNWN